MNSFPKGQEEAPGSYIALVGRGVTDRTPKVPLCLTGEAERHGDISLCRKEEDLGELFAYRGESRRSRGDRKVRS